MLSEDDISFINWFEQNKDYLGPVTEEEVKRYESLTKKMEK